MLQATTRMVISKASALQALEKNGDVPETAMFELEKLAVILSKLPGPTHYLVLHMHIYLNTYSAACSV